MKISWVHKAHREIVCSAGEGNMGHVSFLPGMNAGKNTRAAVQEFVQVLFFPVIALLLTVLLSALVMTCTAVSWMWQKYP